MRAPPVPMPPWADVAWHVACEFRPFDRPTHHVLLGTSGSGKSHMIRYGILPALGPYAVVVIIDLKPGGDRVWRGVGHHVGPGELPCPLWPARSAGWPAIWHVSAPGGLTAAEVRPMLAQLAAERSVIVVLDDATTITDSGGERGGMGLGGMVDLMLREGRTNGLSVILGLNSPTWAGRGGAKSLAGNYWIGHTAGREARDGFANLAGLPAHGRAALDPPVMTYRRWLYSTSDLATGLHVLAVTQAPAA